MAVDKEGLLAAVAQAGEQGRKDYEAAQAANQAAQAQAIQAALMGAAQNVNAGGAAQLQRIVSQPYQTSAIHLNENQAASGDWFNRLGASANQWGTVMGGLNEAVTARALAEAAAGGSGGGGSGGGSGGSGADAGDWYSGLKDAFGTASIAKSAIAAEADALGLTQYKNSGMAPHEAVAKYAEENYGIPAGVAMAWYPQSKEDVKASKSIQKLIPGVVKGNKTMKQLKTAIRQGNRQTPGDQTYLRKQAVEQARQLKQQRQRAQQQRRRRRR